MCCCDRTALVAGRTYQLRDECRAPCVSRSGEIRSGRTVRRKWRCWLMRISYHWERQEWAHDRNFRIGISWSGNLDGVVVTCRYSVNNSLTSATSYRKPHRREIPVAGNNWSDGCNSKTRGWRLEAGKIGYEICNWCPVPERRNQRVGLRESAQHRENRRVKVTVVRHRKSRRLLQHPERQLPSTSWLSVHLLYRGERGISQIKPRLNPQ